MKPDFQMGPAMRRLNERQRLFVEHFVASGQRNASASVIAAGYSDSTANVVHVNAHRMTHDEKVGAAIKELVGQQFNVLAPMALSNIASIASDRDHRDCLTAARFICEVMGFSPTKRIELESNVTVSLPDLRSRALELLTELGSDAKLIEMVIEDDPEEHSQAPSEEPANE